MRRRIAAATLVALLAVSAGCTGLFGGSAIDRGQLDREETYDWETPATTTIRVQPSGEYHVLVEVSNTTELRLFTWDMFGSEQPLSIAGLQFRYPNGTVVNASAFEVSAGGDRTVLGLPAAEGTVAYTASSQPKDFATPVPVAGSVQLVLPEGMRVDAPLFGSVRPGPTRTDVVDGRAVVSWEEVGAGEVIDVRYYLERDFYVFTALVVGLLTIGLLGAIYLRFQIRRLQRRREESGLAPEER